MKKFLITIILAFWVYAMTGCATSHFYQLPAKEYAEFDYGFEVKKIAVRNINVAVIDEGQGDQVLLLIHGLGSNAKGWIKNIPVLAKNYRVIAVDLPGYGKSDKGYYQYTMSFYAQVLSELLTKMNVDKAVYIGHSMGGQIAITSALEFPDKVEKLVLISPAGFERFTDGEGAWMSKAVSAEFVHDTPIRNIAVNLKSNFYEYTDDAEFMITERIEMRGAKDFDNYCYAVSKNVAAMLDGVVYDRLDKIQQPVLTLFGANDGLIPNPYLHGGHTADIAAIGKEHIKDNKLVTIPECGHFVQFEKAEQANQNIIDFLSSK